MSVVRVNMPEGFQVTPTMLFQSRDVLRAGWLKYIPFAERLPSDEHKFWAVFAVVDGTVPYIEFYQKRQSGSGQRDGPVSRHSLAACRHVLSVISPKERHYEFTITLDTHVIRLAAESEEAMYDWMAILRTKLTSMGILGPAENLYSRGPTPFADLPPIPTHYQANDQQHLQPQQQAHSDNEPSDELYEPIFTVASRSIAVHMDRLSLDTSGPPPEEEGPPPYERISSRPHPSQMSPASQRAIVSFREAQVEKLKREMQLMTGLNLKVRKKDCYNSIAFVDILSSGIFIAGWKQKEHPHLHSTFHIGDQLVAINGVAMESATHARSFIKTCPPRLELLVRRVPFGQVFCLKRTLDGEDLGLLRDRGTALIVAILPHSIAAQAGLSEQCSFYTDEEAPDSEGSLWCLTEINNRPLNLLFKKDEVADRLSAIGKEISLLVQPAAFVRRLRKQLKTYKNYKDYIVQ